MRVLVLAAAYPDNQGNVSLYYIHTRNIYYVEHGITVSVLNFSAQSSYDLDGVRVITVKDVTKELVASNDLIICHAPNIRNHYKFIYKYKKEIGKIVFFFHGHEVLRCSKVYPKPYKYVKKEAFFKTLIKDVYDIFKLKVWHFYFSHSAMDYKCVFVSQWMKNQFCKWTNIKPVNLEENSVIIYNSIGHIFETAEYDPGKDIEYDFITIRNNIDGSKYCIDIVNYLAHKYPQYRFCIVGKGLFFEHYDKPDNLIHMNKALSHKEIIDILNRSACALLPTRTDAQGVMACEVATFGIPLITSAIDVCEEIFSSFQNVFYIQNESPDADFQQCIHRLSENRTHSCEKNSKFFEANTVAKEIELFKDMLNT